MKGAGALGLVALAAVAAWFWKKEADVQQLASKLIDTLPARLAQWGDSLARAANNTAPASVSPLKWAFLLAAVMDRESNGGNTLRPRGPAGAGDWSARKGQWLARSDIAQVVDQLPDGWLPPRDRQGNLLPSPYAVPLDGVGWGRGLMQLDLGSYPELLFATPTAAENIAAGGMQLRTLYLRLGADLSDDEKIRRVAAAYNAGPRALTAADPDSLTTGGNYGSDVLARAAGFEEAAA